MEAKTRSHWIATHILPHEREIRGWLRRRVSLLTAADLDDLIQEAYARLWRADLSTIANGRGYFYTVVRNIVLERARRARIVPMERLTQAESLRIMSEEPGPDRRVIARQELDQLLEIVRGLPPQWRRAFELQRLKGLSLREISREMNLAEKTVEKYLGLAFARVVEARIESEGDASHSHYSPGVIGNDRRETHD